MVLPPELDPPLIVLQERDRTRGPNSADFFLANDRSSPATRAGPPIGGRLHNFQLWRRRP